MTDAPAVHMLWESTDPEAALRQRFGFDGAARAVAWLADTLGQHWGSQ